MIRALERLRSIGKVLDEDYLNAERTLNGIADAVQAEVDSRYMELPLDADGVPIRIGDVIQSEYEIPTEVTRMELLWSKTTEPSWMIHWGDPDCMGDEDDDWGDFADRPEGYRHVKPRTVDDVLVELLASCGKPTLSAYDERAIKKYAAELQMKGGE